MLKKKINLIKRDFVLVSVKTSLIRGEKRISEREKKIKAELNLPSATNKGCAFL